MRRLCAIGDGQVAECIGEGRRGVFETAGALADDIGLTGDDSWRALTGGCPVIELLTGRSLGVQRDTMKLMKSYLMCEEQHVNFIENYKS